MGEGFEDAGLDAEREKSESRAISSGDYYGRCRERPAGIHYCSRWEHSIARQAVQECDDRKSALLEALTELDDRQELDQTDPDELEQEL